MKKAISLLLALTLLTLAACGGQERTAPDGPEENPPAQVGGTDPADAPEPGPADSPAPEEEPAPEKPEEPPVPAREEYLILDPTVMPEGGQRDGVTYEAYDGIVEHLFFHPIIAYTELAFDGDAQANGLDDYMVTVDEFNKILDSLYEKDYILVDIGDVWSETTGEDGAPKMVRNTLYIPEGKKPMVFSYDDTNYYPYMLENGFAHKLIIGEDLKIASYGLDPEGIREMRELLLRLNRERGLTILVSSHILGELSKIATRYGIIQQGRMVEQITAEELEQKCADYLHLKTSQPQKAAALLEQAFRLTQWEMRPEGEIRIYQAVDAKAVGQALAQAGIAVEELGLHRQDLEGYFLERMEGMKHV